MTTLKMRNIVDSPDPVPTGLTISDVEQKIQAGLEELRRIPFAGAISEALKYLIPEGKQVRVELEKDGGSKRRFVATDWRPGEAVLHYEDATTGNSAQGRAEPLGAVASTSTQSEATDLHTGQVEIQIGQLCSALASAEKAGKSFISLKWFRDEALTTHGYSWAKNPENRQTILARAIEAGAVTTSRIPNPRAPMHPTTTIKLNASSRYAQTVSPRFQPIKTNGAESASGIVLRDRGRN